MNESKTETLLPSNNTALVANLETLLEDGLIGPDATLQEIFDAYETAFFYELSDEGYAYRDGESADELMKAIEEAWPLVNKSISAPSMLRP